MSTVVPSRTSHFREIYIRKYQLKICTSYFKIFPQLFFFCSGNALLKKNQMKRKGIWRGEENCSGKSVRAFILNILANTNSLFRLRCIFLKYVHLNVCQNVYVERCFTHDKDREDPGANAGTMFFQNNCDLNGM